METRSSPGKCVAKSNFIDVRGFRLYVMWKEAVVEGSVAIVGGEGLWTVGLPKMYLSKFIVAV